MNFRVGIGQDSHRFSSDPKKKLMLGGVYVEGEPGLEGNSDADVIIHALCRALEQALGNESFSIYADQMHKDGIDSSIEYLKKAKTHLDEAGFSISNIGLSIEAKKPNIGRLSPNIKNKLSEILEIQENQIGIAATSGEGLTAFGRGEGIQAWAIVGLMGKK